MSLLPEDLAYERMLADSGELAGVVAHEFNDILNTIMLHVALVERTASEEVRRDLTEIRKQSKTIAGLVRQFQRYGHAQRSADRPVDVNGLIADAVNSLADAARVTLQLEPSLLPIPGNAADFKRLVTFLLRNALAATPPVGTVTIRTRQAGERVALSVEDSGPALPLEALSHFFDLYFNGRAGTNGLELSACKRLVRRMHGDIRCENGSQGGLAVLAELPASAD